MSNKHDIWKPFGVVYCLNQDSRPDRWKLATEEFARVGLKVDRFSSIPADQPYKSFCLSQYAMLKTFVASGHAVGLLLEDDVIFQSLEHLPAALAELPKDWDILYLGANITEMVTGIKDRPPMRYSKHLCRVGAAWTTHAVAYSRAMAIKIISTYPVNSYAMYDQWLNENILASHQCFLVNPMLAFQRPGKSDLWSQETDYTGAFVHGNKIMAI